MDLKTIDTFALGIMVEKYLAPVFYSLNLLDGTISDQSEENYLKHDIYKC